MGEMDSVVLTILMLIFGRSDLYVNALGFFALGLESTLPLPQLYRYESSLIAWFGLQRLHCGL